MIDNIVMCSNRSSSLCLDLPRMIRVNKRCRHCDSVC
jgi:hypothetical protein